jgi:adenosine receptor A2a
VASTTATMLPNSTASFYTTLASPVDPISKLDIPYTIMEILVAVVAVFGNALVIIVFYRERRLRRRTNYYIISLAIADLLVGLLGIPFAILASVRFASVSLSRCTINYSKHSIRRTLQNWFVL